MRDLLFVFLGGGAGSILRYMVSRWLNTSFFPWGTLAVNIIGCFLVSLFGTWIARVIVHLYLPQRCRRHSSCLHRSQTPGSVKWTGKILKPKSVTSVMMITTLVLFNGSFERFLHNSSYHK